MQRLSSLYSTFGVSESRHGRHGYKAAMFYVL